MKYVNLTPHSITLFFDDQRIDLEACVTPARCEQEEEIIHYMDVFPVVRLKYGAVVHLPEPREGVVYIASLLACQAARAAGRMDVYAVTQTVRDENGRIVGAKALTDGHIYNNDWVVIENRARSIANRNHHIDDGLDAYDIINICLKYNE